MRFELPEQARAAAALDQPSATREGGPSAQPTDVEHCHARFCIPADGVHCAGCQWSSEVGKCYRPDCDALFTPPQLRRQQRGWARDAQPQLIITAGPERSGSTWLYNAVRLLFQHARKPLDAYWLKTLTDDALDVRGAGRPGSNAVLVKTHAWSEEWTLSRATHIFVTHRDLRQVLASYRRMTWEWELPDDYVADHMCWKDHAELDIAFEDIISSPEALLRQLVQLLALEGSVDCHAVLEELSSLPVPTDWVDPVTQIWPSHISTPYMEARKALAVGESLSDAQMLGLEPSTPSTRARLDEEAAARLLERFPEYFSHYGYSL